MMAGIGSRWRESVVDGGKKVCTLVGNGMNNATWRETVRIMQDGGMVKKT